MQLRSFLVAASALVLGMVSVTGAATAQVADHLQCHRIKDTARFKGVVLSLEAVQSAFQVPDDCEIKPGRGLELCVPVKKTVVEAGTAPVPGVLPPTEKLVNDYVCYKVKCPKAVISDTLVTDQFGSRTLEKVKSARRLCVPAIKGLPTPTTTSTTTTTTLRPLCGQDGVCTVFVTSQSYPSADLSGLPGADENCNLLAQAAGLDGPYVAWLSTSTQGAAQRLDDQSPPFKLVDGTPVADSLPDLLDANLHNPINATEAGAIVVVEVWTGSNSDGT